MASPIGGLRVDTDEAGVCGVWFAAAPLSAGSPPPDSMLERAVEQLTRYFAGELTAFDIPLSVTGGNDFERAVWRAIAAVPYGKTRTYGEIAADVGEPGAGQAVGVACNHNPTPVIVPCHRVVAAGGKLGGFGGGLARKRTLLELEALGSFDSWFAE
jgi:methylated-DNA-[protein]-cysteine S-methyltransferase